MKRLAKLLRYVLPRGTVLPSSIILLAALAIAFAQGTISLPPGQGLNFISSTGQVILRTAANNIDVIIGSHLGGSSAPVANACAGFALSGGASDVGGTITYTSAATCSITFGRAFVNAPTCVANSIGATPAAASVATTTTGATFTFAAAQTQIEFVCIGS